MTMSISVRFILLFLLAWLPGALPASAAIVTNSTGRYSDEWNTPEAPEKARAVILLFKNSGYSIQQWGNYYWRWKMKSYSSDDYQDNPFGRFQAMPPPDLTEQLSAVYVMIDAAIASPPSRWLKPYIETSKLFLDDMLNKSSIAAAEVVDGEGESGGRIGILMNQSKPCACFGCGPVEIRLDGPRFRVKELAEKQAQFAAFSVFVRDYWTKLHARLREAGLCGCTPGIEARIEILDAIHPGSMR